MSKSANATARLRAALLASSACAALMTTVVAVHAQDSAASASQKVEKVTVTGSRIARKNLDSTNTTSIVTTDQIYRNGSANIADLFNSLPQFAPTLSRTSTTFSGTASSGLNQSNLRNLGSVETLTLINGRRAPGGNITGLQVDLNTIPSANIERIEILTGGASAIYGADAVAGVVNIVTRKSFEGFEAGASYGAAELGDNINPRGFMTFGSGIGEKGHFTVTGEYEFQGQVNCRDRTLCETDFAWFPPGAPVRGPNAFSSVAPQGRFFIDAGNGNLAQNWTLRSGAWVTPFNVPVDGYDRNPNRTIAQPTSRLMFAADAEYEILPRVRAFSELNYGSSKTDSAFEGQPFQSTLNGIGGPPPFPGVEVTIPIDNPFIPSAAPGSINLVPAAQDIRAAMVARGDTALTWTQRFDVFGLRGADNLRQTVRAVGGLRGDMDSLFGLGSDWNWEVSYVYGRTSLDALTGGLMDLTHLYAGLRVEASGVADNPATPDREDFRCVDPGQRALGCVPINPFGGAVAGSYSQNMINYIVAQAGVRGNHELEDATAYLGGSLFALPAGDVQIVAGAEWRRTLGDLDYDTGINNGTLIGNIIGDSRSQNKSQELFGEISVPIIADSSFTKSLTVEGSYRTSHTDGQGTFDTWKYGGMWEPIGGLRLRGVQSRAIRAPNTSEQSGAGQTFQAVNDPCAQANIGLNPNRAANCLADGFNAGPYTPALAVLQQVGGFTTGNPNVKPEVADTLTYGLVITPELIPNLSFTIDRFDITVDKQIATIGRQLIANLCYDLVGAQRAQYCTLTRRGFNPNVQPPNPVAYNNLALTDIFDTVQNNSRSDVKGVDIELQYRADLADWLGEDGDLGSLRLGALVSLYDDATTVTTVPGTAPALTNFLGFAGAGGQLERQGKVDVGYSIDGWRFNWTARYVGESVNSPFVAAAAQTTIPDFWYHNVQGSWDVTPNYQFYFGATNIADQDPPFFPTNTTGIQALDTIPQYYDVYGRSFYAGFKVRFE
ncbi:MAG: TonB-dependent receptor [Alphaproteobacteria bacterium]|nr:TonB-dependent receptor [Alphaproteobacteria bacterium]